jgi:hypothetical protein
LCRLLGIKRDATHARPERRRFLSPR